MFNGFYNPYFQSSYLCPVNDFGRQDPEACQRQHARAEALLAQRSRRAQYLPHEEIDSEDGYSGPFGPRGNYLEARRQQALDNERRRRDAEAQRYRQQLEELRRRREHAQRKQHVPNDDTSSHQRYFSRSSQEQSAAARAPYRQEPATSATQTTAVPSKDSSSRPPTSPVEYTDVHHEAAQQIQRLYRQWRSLHSIDNIVSQFQEARNSFTVPQAIDFINSSVPSISSTDENLITVDTTSDSGVNIFGSSAYIVIDATGTEPSEVAPSGTEAASLDQSHEANAMDDETLNGMPQLPEPTPPADDEFVMVKDDEPSSTRSRSSEIPSADGEFVIIEDDQPSVAAQTETTVNNQVEIVIETRETPSVDTAAITERQSDETVGDVYLEETTPRLAYTTRNYPLHAYMEKLNVLLTKLDTIESYGSQNVRDGRKEVARSIEREAERIELLLRGAWRKHSRA